MYIRVAFCLFLQFRVASALSFHPSRLSNYPTFYESFVLTKFASPNNFD